MKVVVGSIDRTVGILAGMDLVGLIVVGTMGPWGYIGIVPAAHRAHACVSGLFAAWRQ